MFWRATPKVYVIVALSRPQLLQFVYFQFQRFTYPNKELVIVECGKARGECSKQGLVPDMLLEHDGTAGQCRNKALDALDNKQGYWVSLDDDDFYGKNYIEEHLKLHRKNGRPITIGKYEHVVMNDCMLKLKESPMTLQGSSLGGKLPCDIRYLEKAVGEEVSMVKDLKKVEKGSLPIAVSRLGKPNSHTWKAPDEKILSMHTEARICDGGSIYDYIEKRKEPRSEIILPLKESLLYLGAKPVSLGLPSYIPYSI